MAVIRKVCFCCGLRAGAMFVATYSLLSSAFFIAILLIRNIGYRIVESSIIHAVVTYGSFVLFGLLMLVSVGLIIGVHKENRWMFVPWIVQTLVALLFATGTIVWMIVIIIRKGEEQSIQAWEIAVIVFHSINLICSSYCIICVIALFQDLSGRRRSSRSTRQRRQRRSQNGAVNNSSANTSDRVPRPPALPVVTPPPYSNNPPPAYTTFPRGAPQLNIYLPDEGSSTRPAPVGQEQPPGEDDEDPGEAPPYTTFPRGQPPGLDLDEDLGEVPPYSTFPRGIPPQLANSTSENAPQNVARPAPIEEEEELEDEIPNELPSHTGFSQGVPAEPVALSEEPAQNIHSSPLEEESEEEEESEGNEEPGEDPEAVSQIPAPPLENPDQNMFDPSETQPETHEREVQLDIESVAATYSGRSSGSSVNAIQYTSDPNRQLTILENDKQPLLPKSSSEDEGEEETTSSEISDGEHHRDSLGEDLSENTPGVTVASTEEDSMPPNEDKTKPLKDGSPSGESFPSLLERIIKLQAPTSSGKRLDYPTDKTVLIDSESVTRNSLSPSESDQEDSLSPSNSNEEPGLTGREVEIRMIKQKLKKVTDRGAQLKDKQNDPHKTDNSGAIEQSKSGKESKTDSKTAMESPVTDIYAIPLMKTPKDTIKPPPLKSSKSNKKHFQTLPGRAHSSKTAKPPRKNSGTVKIASKQHPGHISKSEVSASKPIPSKTGEPIYAEIKKEKAKSPEIVTDGRKRIKASAKVKDKIYAHLPAERQKPISDADKNRKKYHEEVHRPQTTPISDVGANSEKHYAQVHSSPQKYSSNEVVIRGPQSHSPEVSHLQQTRDRPERPIALESPSSLLNTPGRQVAGDQEIGRGKGQTKNTLHPQRGLPRSRPDGAEHPPAPKNNQERIRYHKELQEGSRPQDGPRGRGRPMERDPYPTDSTTGGERRNYPDSPPGGRRRNYSESSSGVTRPYYPDSPPSGGIVNYPDSHAAGGRRNHPNTPSHSGIGKYQDSISDGRIANYQESPDRGYRDYPTIPSASGRQNYPDSPPVGRRRNGARDPSVYDGRYPNSSSKSRPSPSERDFPSSRDSPYDLKNQAQSIPEQYPQRGIHRNSTSDPYRENWRYAEEGKHRVGPPFREEASSMPRGKRHTYERQDYKYRSTNPNEYSREHYR